MQKHLAGENSASVVEMVEWNRWKNNVSMDILVLNERISVLEKKILDMNSHAISTENKIPSKANRNIDSMPTSISSSGNKIELTAYWKDTATYSDAYNQGIGYLPTMSRVVRGKKHAQFQLILLIVCVVTFVWYGSITFMSAIKNEQSEFKPSFKQYAVNYTDSDQLLLYQMPYLFLRMIISFDRDSEYADDKEKLLLDISESQHNFQDRVIVSYQDKINLYPNVSLWPYIENDAMGDSNSLIVGFRMTVGEIPTNGVFWIIALLDIQSIALGGNVTVEHLNVILDRETLPSGTPLVIDQYNEGDDEFDVFIIGYTEMVTKKYRSKKSYSEIDMTWSQTAAPIELAKAIHNITVEPSYIMFHLKPNLEVDHWKEYVTFGYADWLTGMGGLFSLTVAGFLWTSYGIAVRFGDGISMGILPGLSYNFFSYEEILWIKRKLGSSGVI